MNKKNAWFRIGIVAVTIFVIFCPYRWWTIDQTFKGYELQGDNSKPVTVEIEGLYTWRIFGRERFRGEITMRESDSLQGFERFDFEVLGDRITAAYDPMLKMFSDHSPDVFVMARKNLEQVCVEVINQSGPVYIVFPAGNEGRAREFAGRF